jgi:hypothetical protein
MATGRLRQRAGAPVARSQPVGGRPERSTSEQVLVPHGSDGGGEAGALRWGVCHQWLTAVFLVLGRSGWQGASLSEDG